MRPVERVAREARAPVVVMAVLTLSLAVGAAAPAGAATLFVTNTRSDSIPMIDTGTLEATGTIPMLQCR